MYASAYQPSPWKTLSSSEFDMVVVVIEKELKEYSEQES